MRFGERGRGIWTAAIAEADKQTTQRGEAIFPHGHTFRRALRRGVCPGSGTGTWRSLMQKLPLIHGHNTRERTESSLQFKPLTCCSAEVFPARMGERGHLWARVLRHASAARGRVSFPSSPLLVLTGGTCWRGQLLSLSRSGDLRPRPVRRPAPVFLSPPRRSRAGSRAAASPPGARLSHPPS